MSRNRLVIAVLILFVSFSRWAAAAPELVAAAPSTQPVDSLQEVNALVDAVFKVDHPSEISLAVLEAEKQDIREPVVIPFPTTFWTGLTTLIGVGTFYMKRRLYR